MASSMFQKRHYEAIAKIIKANVEDANYAYDLHGIRTLDILCKDLMLMFTDDNPRFNLSKFLDATKL